MHRISVIRLFSTRSQGLSVARCVSASSTSYRVKRFQMNSFHLSIVALFVALIFSAGSSSPASTDYSHPQFTVADDRTLSLRETSSRIVMGTIKERVG